MHLQKPPSLYLAAEFSARQRANAAGAQELIDFRANLRRRRARACTPVRRARACGNDSAGRFSLSTNHVDNDVDNRYKPNISGLRERVFCILMIS